MYMGIYLDNAASTRVKPRVLEKFNSVATNIYGNPSSEHWEGMMAEECIKEVKKDLSSRLNCERDDIFFTMGATMSNQLCIQGFLAKNPNGMVVTTNVEHNDIMMLMKNVDCYRHILSVKRNGLISLSELRSVLDYAVGAMNVPVLVVIQMANSETGIIQPIEQIGKMVGNYSNVLLYVDATQYIPYYPIDMKQLNIHGLSMSGQKIGGIKGSGLFVANQTLRDHIKPVIYGEQGLIGGTPSAPLIASLGEAFLEIDYDVSSLQHKRDVFLSYLQDMGGVLVGGLENRLPNNIYIRFPGIDGLSLLYLLDEQAGIYIGTGSACSTNSDEPSHVAKAYGLSDKEAFECVRFTLSDSITYDEIESVVNTIKRISKFLKEEEGQ